MPSDGRRLLFLTDDGIGRIFLAEDAAQPMTGP
jgi:hypothetical protein